MGSLQNEYIRNDQFLSFSFHLISRRVFVKYMLYGTSFDRYALNIRNASAILNLINEATSKAKMTAESTHN